MTTAADVDDWFCEHLHLEDDALRAARERAQAEGLPDIAVPPSHGAGVREVVDLVDTDPRLELATALQTVGRKGWDGFLVAVVGTTG